MASFKVKHDKNKHIIQINTLDETHKKFMETFKQKKESLPNKKRKLGNLQTQLNAIEEANPSNYTNDDIKKRAKLKTDIKNLESDIYDIENDQSELDYYFKTTDIIMEYYQITDMDDKTLYEEFPELSKEKDKNELDKQQQKPDLLDILNKQQQNKKKVKTATKRRKKRMPDINKTNILEFFNGSVNNDVNNTEKDLMEAINNENNCDKNNKDNNETLNKAELLNQYMMLIDSEYMADVKKNTDKIKRCYECNIEKTLVQSEGIYVCQNCGEAEIVIVDSDKPNYKDAVTDTKPGYPYKRTNHLNEWLAQFQAKESIEIPDDIYNQILDELRKNRFTDLKKLDLPYMKKILKNLKLTAYYEHIAYLISKINGLPPPTINRETEEKIRLMFRQIQAPFEKHCPKLRTNFLSYAYVLHKMFQLLELDEFVKYFPLLKSREKLKLQDELWEKICNDLNWEFYPSV